MAIEVRTDPPIVILAVRGTAADGTARTAQLRADPFNEKQGAVEKNAKIMATMPTIDTNKAPSQAEFDEWQRKLQAWNDKNHSATSVFIDGLDEDAMVQFIEYFRTNTAAALRDASTFKGTRFAGADKSMCSIAARCLKIGLPDDLKVSIGVKIRWEVADVVRYAVAIRDALSKKGVAQPDSGYTGARSGLLANVY